MTFIPPYKKNEKRIEEMIRYYRETYCEDHEKFRKLLDYYYLSHIHWFRQAYGYTKGKQFAEDHNRKILLSFSGKTWCGPCIMLEGVFQSDLFKAWALEEELVLINVDYDPVTFTDEDLALFVEYDVQINLNDGGHYGLPMVFGLASDGTILGGVEGYPDGGTDEWIELFEVAIHES